MFCLWSELLHLSHTHTHTRVFRLSLTLTVCMSNTYFCSPTRTAHELAHRRSGGQALSWVLGVPGASACLLEATVPYSTTACDEKMAAGPPAPGYCSREVSFELGLRRRRGRLFRFDRFFRDIP